MSRQTTRTEWQDFITAPFWPTGWESVKGIEPWRAYPYLHVPAHITYFSRRWFEQYPNIPGLRMMNWDNSHENGPAFELVLARQ